MLVAMEKTRQEEEKLAKKLQNGLKVTR